MVVIEVAVVCGQRVTAASCGGSRFSQGRARPPVATSSEISSRSAMS